AGLAWATVFPVAAFGLTTGGAGGRTMGGLGVVFTLATGSGGPTGGGGTWLLALTGGGRGGMLAVSLGGGKGITLGLTGAGGKGGAAGLTGAGGGGTGSLTLTGAGGKTGLLTLTGAGGGALATLTDSGGLAGLATLTDSGGLVGLGTLAAVVGASWGPRAASPARTCASQTALLSTRRTSRPTPLASCRAWARSASAFWKRAASPAPAATQSS